MTLSQEGQSILGSRAVLQSLQAMSPSDSTGGAVFTQSLKGRAPQTPREPWVPLGHLSPLLVTLNTKSQSPRRKSTTSRPTQVEASSGLPRGPQRGW